MRRVFVKCSLSLAVASAALPAFAQLASPPATAPAVAPKMHAQAASLAEFRATQLKGATVRTPQGDDVGAIDDLVINADTGRVAYAALSVGGFLGMGDKMFAVPYDAIAFQPADQPTADDNSNVVQPAGTIHDANHNAEVVGVMNVSQDAFKNAKGFDQDHWPDFADTTWRTTNETAFKSVPRRYQHSDAVLDARLVRASELLGLNVGNAKDDTVGEINDLMIDDTDGHVRYVALSVGGFLGMGDKLFAIPMSSFKIAKDQDEDVTATLAVTKDNFEGLDGFDQDHWPSMADKAWRERSDRAFRAASGHAAMQ